MRLPLVVTALLTGVALLPAAPAHAGTDTVRLDHVYVHVRKHTQQVVTVNHTRGTHARVTFWGRPADATRKDGWAVLFRSRDGRIGYGGLVPARKRVQGSGTTPLGTFRLPWGFGMHAERDRWDDSYRRARPGDYWVLDNRSDFYNRWRNRHAGGFRWRLPSSDPNASERLRDYPKQYEFAVTTSFNAGQVRHRGGAIFLHVNGSGATAGCVSAPRRFVLRTLNHLDPAKVPVIGIGR